MQHDLKELLSEARKCLEEAKRNAFEGLLEVEIARLRLYRRKVTHL